MINTAVEAPDIKIGGGGLSMHGIGRLKFTVELPFTQKIPRGRGVNSTDGFVAYPPLQCCLSFPRLEPPARCQFELISWRVRYLLARGFFLNGGLPELGRGGWLICTTKLYLVCLTFTYPGFLVGVRQGILADRHLFKGDVFICCLGTVDMLLGRQERQCVFVI